MLCWQRAAGLSRLCLMSALVGGGRWAASALWADGIFHITNYETDGRDRWTNCLSESD